MKADGTLKYLDCLVCHILWKTAPIDNQVAIGFCENPRGKKVRLFITGGVTIN